VKAFVAALALVPWLAAAQPADVAAIQAREARHADARTLAALERFRAALTERYGGDPKLTMLAFGESEGEALVLRPGGASEHVIRQGDHWISTDGRRLAPWAGASVAAANAFALSSVRAEPIRAWLEAWRKAPGQATDFVTGYAIGYEPAQARVVVRATVGSMTTGRLSRQTFAAK
jgi:hypothetical protein